jgi:hypothetical protein
MSGCLDRYSNRDDRLRDGVCWWPIQKNDVPDAARNKVGKTEETRPKTQTRNVGLSMLGEELRFSSAKK